MERRKEVRLEHIAEEVGVSIVTVSNALNGRKGVSEELRDRIRDTAAAMGYQMSRSENRKRTEMSRIGVVVAERYVRQFPSFYMDIYMKAAQELNKKGGVSILEVVDEGKERLLHGFTGFLDDEVDGIIIIGEMDRNYIQAVRKEYEVPIVCVDYYDILPDMDYIVCDSFGGMEQLTDLLLDAGCRSLMFVGNPQATGSIMDRYMGYCKALEKRGIPVRREDLILDRFSDGYDYKLRVELPAALPDGFVCNCDKTANILIGELLQRGVKIPEEVSVVGFDHYYSNVQEGLELTTYEYDQRAIAQISTGTILKRIGGAAKASGIRFVEGKVIYGNTVRAAAGRNSQERME